VCVCVCVHICVCVYVYVCVCVCVCVLTLRNFAFISELLCNFGRLQVEKNSDYLFEIYIKFSVSHEIFIYRYYFHEC
jgi:hypothetical protein